jgi:dual-specificity kinase
MSSFRRNRSTRIVKLRTSRPQHENNLYYNCSNRSNVGKSQNQCLQNYSPSSESSGGDDCTRGEINLYPGLILNSRYAYTSILGVGTFGKVILCFDRVNQIYCAIKAVRSVPRYLESARDEIALLYEINQLENNQFSSRKGSRIVKLVNSFSTHEHEFLVFEQLGISLLDALKMRNYSGFPFLILTHITREILVGLRFLHQNKFIHGDLKMENVLFSALNISPMQMHNHEDFHRYNIKLVDFGNCVRTQPLQLNTGIINTRPYRAPEVILDLEWSYPSDIFGVGCITMEMIQGREFYPSCNDAEHVARLEYSRCGRRFPIYMIQKCSQRDFLFNRNGYAIASPHNQKHVSDLIFQTNEKYSLKEDLYDFVWRLLELDPERRTSTHYSLEHELFSYIC